MPSSESEAPVGDRSGSRAAVEPHACVDRASGKVDTAFDRPQQRRRLTLVSRRFHAAIDVATVRGDPETRFVDPTGGQPGYTDSPALRGFQVRGVGFVWSFLSLAIAVGTRRTLGLG